jgi:hypothetical protein
VLQGAKAQALTAKMATSTPVVLTAPPGGSHTPRTVSAATRVSKGLVRGSIHDLNLWWHVGGWTSHVCFNCRLYYQAYAILDAIQLMGYVKECIARLEARKATPEVSEELNRLRMRKKSLGVLMVRSYSAQTRSL